MFDYNTTLYDRTLGNNPSSVGIGVQTMLNTKSIFSPLIEINAQGALEDDDVFRLTKNGEGGTRCTRNNKCIRGFSS